MRIQLVVKVVSIVLSGFTLMPGLWAQTDPIYTYSVAPGGYAPNGNLVNFSDNLAGSWSMQYDSLNRLTQAIVCCRLLYGSTPLGIRWQYDSFGNRLSQTPTYTSNFNSPPPWSATYGANNHFLTSSNPGLGPASYDAAGNLIYDGINHIAYDAENHVCAVLNYSSTLTQYLYNAEGQRVAKGHSASGNTLACPVPGDFVPDEKYILGQSGEQITQLDGRDVWQHTNVYANGQLLATYDQEGPLQLLHYIVSDPQGTKRVQASSTGMIERSSVNLPFGDGLTSIGSGLDATQQHYTGKERDAESGLDYFGARYYASSMGRFSSPDPSGLFFADPTLPQSLNLYSYARNNPLIGTDPTGMAYCQWDDGTHDDSANTGVEGAVNSGTECTNAGGTWSHDDGLNDDGSQMGTEGKASLTVTATLNTSTDETSVSTTGESYDPDNANLYLLAVGITEDTNHAFGCIAGAYGVGAPSAATGTAGSQVFNASQNLVGKTKAAGALGGSTAYTSEAAMAARSSALANIPSFGLKSPVGTPFAGNFAMRTSPNMGVAAGRYAPYIGAAGKAAGVAGTAYSSYKLWNCLGTHP